MIRSDSEFLQFAISHYDNPKLMCLQEFESDLKRFIYINTLIKRYLADKSDLKHRLIINHLIILSNCFSVPGLFQMIKYRIDKENLPVCWTFCYFLGMIDTTETDLDFYLLDILNAE